MSLVETEALELIKKLPDTATTADILEQLNFKEQVDRGLQDVEDGRTISHQELKERIAQRRKFVEPAREHSSFQRN
jgi:predicted transcriptional regulator